jgi:proteic killer suppression protein
MRVRNDSLVRRSGNEDLFNGTRSKAARRACPAELHDAAHRKLDLINAAVNLVDLKYPPGNRLKPLKGDRAGQHSIRINDQYRICFRWENDGAADVEVNKHYE